MPQLADHYRILEIKPNATQQEVKGAYRRLARTYHPDVNAGAYAEARFREIKEAYDVLSNAARRKQYDEERWLSGMGNRARDTRVITPQWLLDESRKLSRHMNTVDTYRMSHSALYDYIMLLLSDSHMAILLQEGTPEVQQAVVEEVLASTRHLKHNYIQGIAGKLAQLAGSNNQLLLQIHNSVSQSRHRAAWDKYFPLIITLIALALCAIMYWWVKK